MAAVENGNVLRASGTQNLFFYQAEKTSKNIITL